MGLYNVGLLWWYKKNYHSVRIFRKFSEENIHKFLQTYVWFILPEKQSSIVWKKDNSQFIKANQLGNEQITSR